jgi:transcriptional regulator with XRE-family HTH domain
MICLNVESREERAKTMPTLLAARLEKGMTQQTLARYMGVSRSDISAGETLKAIPSEKVFKNWAAALGVTLDLKKPTSSVDLAFREARVEAVRKLVQARYSKGLSQTFVAESLRTSLPHISRSETGKRIPKESLVRAWAALLDVDLT